MIKNINIGIADYNYFIFDFDGVLTDNMVNIDQNGLESVKCNRSDGLAFQALIKLKKNVLIFSTELNTVVSSRGKKLNTPVIQGIKDKSKQIRRLQTQITNL